MMAEGKKGGANPHLRWGGRGLCSFGRLLLADERAVNVDVVDHGHACAGLRSIIENKINALDLASGGNRRAGLRRVCGIEAETRPSCSGCWLSGARAAADFVNDIIVGDDHESRTRGRALAASPNVVAEFGNRHALYVANDHSSLRLVGRTAGLRE